MFRAMPLPDRDFCTACFTGKYPVKIDDDFNKTCLECRPMESSRWP
jgi:hypothetical protein